MVTCLIAQLLLVSVTSLAHFSAPKCSLGSPPKETTCSPVLDSHFAFGESQIRTTLPVQRVIHCFGHCERAQRGERREIQRYNSFTQQILTVYAKDHAGDQLEISSPRALRNHSSLQSQLTYGSQDNLDWRWEGESVMRGCLM